MTDDTMLNGLDLAKTSRGARRREIQESESAYLAREIADAKLALLRTTGDLKDSVGQSVDLAPWIKQYPWAAIGVATAAGFAVAAVITPEPGQSISDKWSRLLHQHRSRHPAGKLDTTRPEPSNRTSRVTPILGSVFDLAKLVIEALIVAALRAPVAPPDQDDTNREDPAARAFPVSL